MVLKIHAALEELKPQLTTLNHIKYNLNVVVLKIHAALEELKPQLTTLNHIKYNFDVLERDYLPEEKDLRREESPER